MTHLTAPQDRLLVDRDQIEILVDCIFRGTPRRFVWLRSYQDDKTQKPFLLHPFLFASAECNGDFHRLAHTASDIAQRCADMRLPIVFCLPDSVFASGRDATEANVLACRSLTVDCDAKPRWARHLIELLLGPPTITTFSGGEWTDPETGECQPKQHLRWRLKDWAEGKALADLKEARRLAALIAGADVTGASLAHCFRWPGSWHKKNLDRPRLCRVETESLQPDVEIDLAEALNVLRQAWARIRPPTKIRPPYSSQHRGKATPDAVAGRFAGLVRRLRTASEATHDRNTLLFWCVNRVADMYLAGDISNDLTQQLTQRLGDVAAELGLDQAEIRKSTNSAMRRLHGAGTEAA